MEDWVSNSYAHHFYCTDRNIISIQFSWRFVGRRCNYAMSGRSGQ